MAGEPRNSAPASAASVLFKLDHPVRLAILSRLARPKEGGDVLRRGGKTVPIVSPKQVAAELDSPLGTVSYHFRCLAGLGLLRVVRRVPRRGAVEHYYARTDALENGNLPVSDEEWIALPESLRQGFALAALRELAELVESGAGGESPGEGWDAVLSEVRSVSEAARRPPG